MEHTYEVTVDWKDSRRGTLAAPDLDSKWEVATPPQFPGGMPNIWSPEHLFVAAINSCLMTTFLAIAENSKLEFASFSSKGSGKLEQIEGKYRISEVILEPVVAVNDESKRERALRVLQKAEQNCLISNSVTSRIVFRPEVKVLSHAL